MVDSSIDVAKPMYSLLLTTVLVKASRPDQPGVAILQHADLIAGGAIAEATMHKAFIGDDAFSLIVIKDIPGFSDARRLAFNATIEFARFAPPHSRRPRSAWPGFRHPRHIDDPLQGGFLHVSATAPCPGALNILLTHPPAVHFVEYA